MVNTASNREKYIWNMLGSLSSAVSSFILSISVNRILGAEDGGFFAFAYANAQQMITIGQFEVRPYQATDINEKYNFNTYYSLRLLTCLAMIVFTVIYILYNGFTVEKSITIFFFVVFRVIEAYADVFGGRFQQKDRIDLAGKLLFFRVTFSTIGFIVAMAVTHSLAISSVIMSIISIMLFIVYDYRFVFVDDKKNMKITNHGVMDLFREIFPLFLSIFIITYISNAPKYAINKIYGDEMQNTYNILFMLAFVINMFSLFIFRPLLLELTENWNDGKLNEMWRMIGKMCVIVLGFTLVALVGTSMVGTLLLSAIYGIDLNGYKQDLLLVMVSGGISALMSVFYYLVTVMRQQKLILIGHLIAFAYCCMSVKGFVGRFGIRGAILTYGSSITILVVFFIITSIFFSLTRKNMS